MDQLAPSVIPLYETAAEGRALWERCANRGLPVVAIRKEKRGFVVRYDVSHLDAELSKPARRDLRRRVESLRATSLRTDPGARSDSGAGKGPASGSGPATDVVSEIGSARGAESDTESVHEGRTNGESVESTRSATEPVDVSEMENALSEGAESDAGLTEGATDTDPFDEETGPVAGELHAPTERDARRLASHVSAFVFGADDRF